MASLTGDGAPKDLRNQADAEEESTRVDRLVNDAILSDEQDRLNGVGPSERTDAAIREAATELARAVRTEARAAYLGGVPDKHHPDL